VRDRFPVLAEAILSGATTQIRNMATVAGNILQRTRCSYFRDVHASCNRRQPGSGCDALDGFNRGHAVLGVSEHCIATHPSDMCVALAVLDAEVHTVRPDGATRSISFRDFHCAPGETPHVEVVLAHGELITHVVIPGGDRVGSYRAAGDHVAGRICRGGERRRARCRRAVRRRT
jgi:xanthine dehydrogenase YagS FAD-binding subunit